MKSDKAFESDWQRSHVAAAKVAEWFHQNGAIKVIIPEPRLRPDPSVRRSYRDTGDLHVTYRGASGREHTRVVEVKHRKVHFTGRGDYPYPTIFVDEWYHLGDDRLANLLAYVIVNASMTHLAYISVHTAQAWITETKKDVAQARMCSFASCPRELAVFLTLGL